MAECPDGEPRRRPNIRQSGPVREHQPGSPLVGYACDIDLPHAGEFWATALRRFRIGPKPLELPALLCSIVRSPGSLSLAQHWSANAHPRIRLICLIGRIARRWHISLIISIGYNITRN